MKGISVKYKDAQKVKEDMEKKGIFDRDYKPKKYKDRIVFPLKEEIDEYDTVSEEFEPIQDNNDYKDYLPKKVQDSLPSSYDIIGDIIVIEIPEELTQHEKKIGEALMKTHKNVRSVFKKAGVHQGEFRTRPLELLAGEDDTETIYTENNTRLKFDVEKVYFSPRLSRERKRIFSQVKKKENVLVMFSGCGPYVVQIAKNTGARVVGVEKNKLAHDYAVQNVKLNKLDNVELINDDVRDVQMKEKFDRIVMPLPKDADDFLDVAFTFAKKGAIIHLYGFSHRDDLDETQKSVKKYSSDNNIKVQILRTEKCGQYSPCKYRVCVDFKVK